MMRNFLLLAGMFLMAGALAIACTSSQRAEVAHAVGPCAECALPLVEEVIAADDHGVTSLAFNVPPPPRPRRVLHRHCTAWTPVDAGPTDGGDDGR